MEAQRAELPRPWSEQEADPILAEWAANALADLQRNASIDLEFYRNQDPVRASRLERFLAEVRESDLAGFPTLLARHGVGPIPWPQIPGLEIVRLLGRGGTGLVFEARQQPFGQRVAVKVLPRPAFLEPLRLRRLEIETRALAQLQCPSIVPIHEVHLDGEFPHIIMAFIEGSTLEEWLRRARQDRDERSSPSAGSRPLDPQTPQGIAAIVRGVKQAAEGLARAHELGILHRDLKPSNLLIDTRGDVRLVDFGMVLVGAGESGTTGDPLAGLRYTPPELVAGTSETIDRRSDVYALGAILYEALALRPAFDQTDRLSLLVAIARRAPLPLRRQNRAVSVELETVVAKAMAREPADRYADAARFAGDLQRLLDQEPIRARRPTLLDRSRVFLARRKRAVWTCVAAALGLGLIASIALTWVNATLRDSLARQQRALTAYQLQEAQRKFDKGQLETGMQVLDSALDPVSSAWSPRFSAAMLRDMIGRDVTLLKGHPDWVIGARLAENGQTLFTADIEGKILGWRVADRSIVADFPPTGQPVLQMAVSAQDSRLLAQEGKPGAWQAITALRVGNLEDSTWIGTLRAPLGETIAGLALFDRGRRAAVASIDAKAHWNLRFWDLSHGGDGIEPERIETYVTGWLDHRAGSYVVIDSGGIVHVRKLEDRGTSWSSPGPLTEITAAVLSHDASSLALGDASGRIRLYRLDGTGTAQVWQSHRGAIQKLWFDRTAEQIVSLSVTDGVGIRDCKSGRFRTVPLGNGNAPIDAELDETGLRLVTVTHRDENVVQLWDLLEGEPIGSYPGRNALSFRTMFLPDGAVLLYAAGVQHRSDTRYGNLLRLWHPTGQSRRLEMRHGSEVWSTRFTNDGRTLITGGDDTGDPVTLRRWDLDTGALVWGVEAADAMVASTAIDRSEQVVAAAILGEQGLVKLFDMATGAELRTLRGHTGRVWDVVFSPDGAVLASAGLDRAIRLWDPRTGQELPPLLGHDAVVRSIAFRPDGKRLASGGNDRFVLLWDVSSRSSLCRIPVSDNVRDLSFSPDGRLLAGALENGLLNIWDAATGTLLHRIYSGEGQLNALAFNVDGQEIAAAGLSGVITVWDTQSGQELLHLSEPDWVQVNSLAFRNDGLGLVSGDHKGRIRLWAAPPPSTRTTFPAP